MQVLAEFLLNGRGVVRERVPVPAVKEVVAMESLNACSRGGQPDPKFVVHPTRHLLVYPTRPRPKLAAKCRTAVYRISLQQHSKSCHVRNYPAVLAGAK